jgi:hypothetical protein
MVGQASTADLQPGEGVLPPNVTYFRGLDETNPLDFPRFGPEITLGQALAEAMPDREIVLVKYAVNGTSLLAWAPEWDSTRAAITQDAAYGPLYQQLLGVVHGVDLRADAEIGAVLWMQGESDAYSVDAGPEYFANLSELIAALRRDLCIPDLPFIMGEVNPPAEDNPALAVVRSAQVRAAADLPGVHLVETDDLTKKDDHLHYDGPGLRELGRRFAATVLEELGRW